MRQPTVLVADDDRAILALLQHVFTLDGYTVLTARGGWDTLERARLQQPDVIVLDLQLPDLDGVDVSWRLRTDPRTAAIPIVVLSATAEAYPAAPLLPVNERVCKPFDLARLSQAVGRWAHQR
jgi:CheY-like chemotaxis protein